MARIEGKLVSTERGARGEAFAGHIVEARIPVSIALPQGGKTETIRLLRAEAAGDGGFVFVLPDEETVAGNCTFAVRAPSGALLAEVERDKLADLQIKLKPARPIDLAKVEAPPPAAGATVPIRIELHDCVDPARAAGRLVLIWGEERGERRRGADEPALVLLAAERTDGAGRARLALPVARYKRLEAEVIGNSAEPKRFALALDEAGAPPTSAAMTVALPPPEETNAADPACDCATTETPRAPDHEDLLGSDGIYAQDLNGAGCINLTAPNRTIEEYSFYSLVRTTDPRLTLGPRRPKPGGKPLSADALGLMAEISFGASALDAKLTSRRTAQPGDGERKLDPTDSLRQSSQAYLGSGLISARAWRDSTDVDAARKAILDRAAALSEDSLREVLSDPDGFTPVALMTAERRAAVDEIKVMAVLAAPAPGPSDRKPLNAAQMPPWDEGAALATQATTIAHGHLLEFRQQWKADGYSLGDLVYSLPLAPGQKRRMVILDWDREETGRRDEERVFREDFESDLSRSRDVAEIINSTVTESLEGGSNASTWGAGGGIGLGIPIGPGFLGIGVAGGGGGAESEAWQDSARALAASTAQNLSDRTVQASAAVRSQRATVVTSQRQRETVSVTSEVVANHNHCHALTIEYFEVLKHYRMDQRLAAVRECLFVPLTMTRFDSLKALRWQDVLQGRLRERRLAPGFEAIHRIQTGYADADAPAARYCDEQVTEIWGELRIEMNFARPRDPAEGEATDAYLASAWQFWDNLFGAGAAEQAYLTNVAQQALADRIFAEQLAPRLARAFVDSLRFTLRPTSGPDVPMSADVTMVSAYRAGSEHLVTFRLIGAPNLPRTAISALMVDNVTEFAPNSRVILRGASISYRTAYGSFALVPPRRTADDIRPADGAVLRTFSLTRDEERNPRQEDLALRDALLKHLNEHLEIYHHLIWWLMDAGRRFMLLDGFVAPHSGGRSVASVTENRIINVVGNSIVLPVAPGFSIDPTVERDDETGRPVDLLAAYQPAIPTPPKRISLPTRGVHAEAIMGSCNSCEKQEDDRFWRWEEEPILLEPTDIGTTATNTRRQTPPDTTPSDLPAPVVAVQTAPAAPAATGLSAITGLLGTANLFKDVTGLSENQANAIGAFKQALQTANKFGSLAAAGAKAQHAQRNSERVMNKVAEARKKKLLSDDDAKKVTKKLFGVLNGTDEAAGETPLAKEKAVADAAQQVLDGKGAKSIEVSTSSPTGSTEAKVSLNAKPETEAPKVEARVAPAVPLIMQAPKAKGCWAAALAMLKSHAAGTTLSIESALAPGGQAWLDLYNADSGLMPDKLPLLMSAFGLRDASVGALTAEALAARLTERGPLWVIADEDPSATFSVHARVVTGISGDGTPGGTTVFFHDPASSAAGEEKLRSFIAKLSDLANGVSSAFGGFAPQILSN